MQVHEKFKTTITSAGKAPYRAYRQNPANGTAAHLYAFSLAKKYNKTVYVYTGNSYGSRVYRVTFDKNEAYKENNVAMYAVEAKDANFASRVEPDGMVYFLYLTK